MTAAGASADPGAPADAAGEQAHARDDGSAARRPAGRSRRAVQAITGPGPLRTLLIGACVLGYSWIAGGTTPLSTRALLGVLAPGAVLGFIAYGKPPQRIPAPQSVDTAGLSYWVVAIAVLFEWEASAFRANTDTWHPSLTDLINPLIAPHPVRSAAFAIWLLSGWALVKR